eukprot:gene46292-61911_t
MGERTLRRLLVIGASAVIKQALIRGAPAGSWLDQMLARKPRMLVAAALANKTARIPPAKEVSRRRTDDGGYGAQSARRDRENQGFPPCHFSTLRVIWTGSANSHTGQHRHGGAQQAGQMAASDYVSDLQNPTCAEGGVHRWIADSCEKRNAPPKLRSSSRKRGPRFTAGALNSRAVWPGPQAPVPAGGGAPLQRRRRRGQNHNRPLDPRPRHGQVPAVIDQPVLLLERPVVLLVDDDQLQVREGKEKRRPRPDHDVAAARHHRLPIGHQQLDRHGRIQQLKQRFHQHTPAENAGLLGDPRAPTAHPNQGWSREITPAHIFAEPGPQRRLKGGI